MANEPKAPQTPERRLTATERSILEFIQRHEGRPCSKEQLAAGVGRSGKTIDRSIFRLKNEGYIAVEPQYTATGRQLANAYRLLDPQ